MSVRVLSAGSTLHGLKACLAEGTAANLGPVEVSTDHGHNIRDAMLRGECPADVVLLPADMAATLAAAGHVGDILPLGTVVIGGVVRAGTPALRIGTLAELRAALLDADTVLLTRAPTGTHMMSVAERLGLGDAVAAKLRLFETSTALNLHLAGRPDHALGFGPETEIRAGHGVQWIGETPAEVQIALPYAATISARTSMPGEARALLAFLDGAAARDAFGRSGVRNESRRS